MGTHQRAAFTWGHLLALVCYIYVTGCPDRPVQITIRYKGKQYSRSVQLTPTSGIVCCVLQYGYTPLHRMASNNLSIGAAALIEAGANATLSTGAPYSGDTPMATAQQSSAHAVVDVLRKAGVTH